MTDTTEPLDLDAIEARVNAATEGPWDAPARLLGLPCTTVFGKERRHVLYHTGGHEDASFIAHAREDVPALVTAVRERDEILSKISAAVAAGTYSNRELREAIQYIANVLDGAEQREPRATCFCGGDHITGTCLAGTEET